VKAQARSMFQRSFADLVRLVVGVPCHQPTQRGVMR